jgi:hypothetical protein
VGCGLEETYNIITLNAISLSPRTHNPGIIKSNHSNDVNALPLDGTQVLDVAGEMFSRAAGCEGTRDGEKDDFLVGPFCDSSRQLCLGIWQVLNLRLRSGRVRGS